MRQITASNVSGISLFSPADNPVTIAAGVTLGASLYDSFGLLGRAPTDWTIVNFGTVLGLKTGITLQAGGSITNGSSSVSTSRIEGGRYGVNITGNSGTVFNYGTIAAIETVVSTAVTQGYTSSNTTVLGTGIYIRAGGAVVNAPHGVIAGGGVGVDVRRAVGTVVNCGTISGSGTYHRDTYYENTTPTGAGVVLSEGGLVQNGLGATAANATITGNLYGVRVEYGTGTVQNAGAISGFSYYDYYPAHDFDEWIPVGVGVALAGGGTVVNGASGSTAGQIVGGTYGVQISGGAGSLNNQGYIQASHTFIGSDSGGRGYLNWGAAVDLSDGGTVANGPGGFINGGQTGVSIAGPGSIDNAGTIAGGGIWRIFEYGATYPDRIYRNGTAIALAGGRVTNGSLGHSGAVAGADFGVLVSSSLGVVSNFGVVRANGYAANQYYGGSSYSLYLNKTETGVGVALQAGGTVVNGDSAIVTGAAINASSVGIAVSGGVGLVENYGSITAQYATYSQYKGISFLGGVGVSLAGGGKVVNGSAGVSGALILAGGAGVVVSGAFSTVGNDGTIVAAQTADGTRLGGVGVLVTAGGKVNNGFFGVTSALISAVRAGVSVYGGPATVINSGTITAGFGVAFGAGTPTATLSNAGTIIGTGGTAVSFNSGNDVVAITPGAVFRGNVVASAAGVNTLFLSSASTTGVLAGIGSKYQNFGGLSVQAGAHWSLAGTNITGAAFGIALGATAGFVASGKLRVGQSLSVTGSGTLSVATGGRVSVGGATTGALGVVTVCAATAGAAAGTLAGSGTIAQPLVDAGIVRASGGTLALLGAASGAGTVEISAQSVLDAAASCKVARIAFLSGNGETAMFGRPLQVTSLISRFAVSDTIDLLGVVATSVSLSPTSHVLKVTGLSGTLASLHFTNAYSGLSFALGSDGHGGTLLTLKT